MSALRERLGTGTKRAEVIADACVVLDQEVAGKSGISGIAVKTAYSVVKGVRPGFVQQAIDHLLDEFLDQLDPFHREAVKAGKAPGSHLIANASEVADALLVVTDRRAAAADRGILRKTYEKLRPAAHKQVQLAIPRVGALLDKHAPKD